MRKRQDRLMFIRFGDITSEVKMLIRLGYIRK